MKIIDSQGKEYNALDIVNVNQQFFLKKGNLKIKINNVDINSKYVSLSGGDCIEIINENSGQLLFVKIEKQKKEEVKNNTKVCNPFLEPPFQTYPESTAMLGILYAHNNYKEWVYDNYGLIWAYKWRWNYYYWSDFVFGNNSVKGDLCPMIDIEEIDKENLISDKKCILSFIETVLKGRYIFIALDMWAVKEWWSCDEDKKHVNHSVIVYGYDKVNRIVFCADFLKKKYRKYTLTYEQFIGAFIGGYYGGEKKFQIWKYQDIFLDYDITDMKKQIEDFISSKNTMKNNFLSLSAYCNAVYGFEALEYINKCVLSCLAKPSFIDIRSIHLIKVLMQVMKEKVSFFYNRGEINIGDATIVERLIDKVIANISKLEMLCAKNNLRSNEKIINSISGLLGEYVEEIKKVYSLIFDVFDINLSEYEKEKLWRKWDKLKKIDKDEVEIVSDKLCNHNNMLHKAIKIYNQYSDKDCKKVVNNNIENSVKKIIVSDYYENVFPFEIQEDGYGCLGKIINNERGFVNEKKYYYDAYERVKVIEYLSNSYKKNWLVFLYEDKEIVRLRIRLDKGKYVIINVKIQTYENDIIYLYSYKPLINERKIDIYYMQDNQVKSSVRYRCNDELLPVNKWVKEKWCERKKYVYSKDGELLQIYIYHYDKCREMIYSNFNASLGNFTNLNMQLQEEKIVKKFDCELNKRLKWCKSSLKVIFEGKQHKVTFIREDETKKSFTFLEEYDLEEEEINRFNILFAIDIYNILKTDSSYKIKLEYYINGEKIEVQDGSFIRKLKKKN